MSRRRSRLRTGFSTGTAAAAAAQGALLVALGADPPQRVEVALPEDGELGVALASAQALPRGGARAVVIKDAGDDPDVTHGAAIVAEVSRPHKAAGERIEIKGGPGVGRITRPGLPLKVGEPAINPVPRQMIRDALRRAWQQAGPGGALAVEVTISAPAGERLARRTLNPRLGIVGGISILGTTGLVKPFSHEAYTATIESGLSVARAAGQSEAVFSTGGKSEKRARALRPDLPELAFVQIADYFAHALEQAAGQGFKRVGVVSFAGKAIKQAQGLAITHARYAPLKLRVLADWLAAAGAGQELCGQVAAANTARHALDLLREAGALHLLEGVGRRLLAAMRRFGGIHLDLWAMILDYDGEVLFRGSLPGEGA